MAEDSLLDQSFELRLKCIRVTQPIGEFFVAAIGSKDLCEITLADVRRIYKERDVETYLGIQRPLNKSRLGEIGQYVNTVDACFPTAIILAVDGRCAEFDADTNELILRAVQEKDADGEAISRIKIAKVLDGQHRIEGLRAFTGQTFEVNVSIFVDMDIENQAYLFSTVNLAQTKVNKSLVYDLFEYAKARSPQKTSHKIAVALDQLESSPFHRKIKRLGASTKGRIGEIITQATFVEALLPYLTANKIEDRDLFLRGRKPKAPDSQELRKLIFRQMFLDERDIEIADIVLNYFLAVSSRWSIAWRSPDLGVMLSRTNGFKALMRLLRPIYLSIAQIGEVPSVDRFGAVLGRAKIKDQDFNIDNFKPGTSGQAALYQRLMDELGLRDDSK